MLKRIFLHIGSPKTGTTSLQTFCLKNWEWLLSERNVYYPPFVEMGANLEIEHPRHASLVATNDNDHIWKRFAERVNEQTSAETLLISSEWATEANRFAQASIQDTVGRLRRYFPGVDYTIIFYVRRLDDAIKSYYNQLFKDIQRNSPWLAPFPVEYADFLRAGWSDFNPGFHFSRVIHDCEEALGKDNVVCRIFDRVQLKNNNIIDDFFEILKLDVSALERNVEENSRLDDDWIPILSRLYRGTKYKTKAMVKIREKVDAAYDFKERMTPNKELVEEIKGEIDRIDALVPGYRDLFSQRDFSLDLPDVAMEPQELLKFDMLFSIFKYCGTLNAQGQKNHEALSSQLQALVGNEQKRLEDDHYKMLETFINKQQKLTLDRIVATLFPGVAQRIVLFAYGLLLLASRRKKAYTALRKSPYEFIKDVSNSGKGSFLRRLLGWLGPLPLGKP